MNKFKTRVKKRLTDELIRIKSFSSDFYKGEQEGINFALYTIDSVDEPEKPVVPKFVAEWIEDQKESFSDASAIHMYDNLTLDNSNGYYHEVWLWVIAHHHDFIKAWHDGYTVEKEKLYTVEIPNGFIRLVLCKDCDGKLFVATFSGGDCWETFGKCKLTEAEIKEDFEWAWQFAKEVEND